MNKFNASGDTKTRLLRLASAQGNPLIGGLLVDKVARLGEGFWPELSDHDDVYLDSYNLGFRKSLCIGLYEWHKEAREMAFNGCEDGETTKTLEDAFWRVLAGDRDLFCRPAPASLRDDYNSWIRVLETHKRILDLIEQGRKPDMPRDDWYQKALEGSTRCDTALRNCAAGRRFCTTMRSFKGCVPLETEVGDFVFIAASARVPWIVRKVNSTKEEHKIQGRKKIITGDGEYVFVGECFIGRIMDGEEMIDVVDEIAFGPVEEEGEAEESGGSQKPEEQRPVPEYQEEQMQGDVSPPPPAAELQWIKLI